MRRLLCFVFGFAAGYYYNKNKDEIEKNEVVQNEIKTLKKVKDKILKKLKEAGNKMKKSYTSMSMEVDENETKKEKSKKRKK